MELELPFDVDVNRDGHLSLGGCDALELAERWGTPLYVVDEQAVRQRCRRYRRALEALPGGGLAVYAAKAFWVGGMARIVAEEGLGADVSSETEVHLALAAGIPPERLVLHGNNKSPSEMELAVRVGVGRVVADSLWELERLGEAAARAGRPLGVLLRIQPGVRAGFHDAMQTGHESSKFGIPVEDGQARQAVVRVMGHPYLELRGYHVHIGSQILELEPYRQAARVVAGFAVQMARELGAPCAEIDMGGGLGARYVAGDRPPSIEALVETVGRVVADVFASAGLAAPALLVEPGRSIVAEAGTTLYRVGAIKRLASGQVVVAVDGGMSDNPRVALYGARYTAVLARDPRGRPEGRPVRIVGRLCESGDVLIEAAPLPSLASGDVLAVLTTGAYHLAMASNYNGLPRPAVVGVSEGRARLWVRRERWEEMTATDEVLARLAPTGPRTSGA
ncbi:diaminopimelate decarboxylase [Geochorda subterranea]|uniref:Diaminopimelate decarboxylase n=1 Tax=Geochorda subterranea TaxID=3109564 RepID=A0ABZ1BTX5_9FIRM|nr:diaminopimelate decarboxylase [Limnochorda sp. LNt]WRP15890.1 diaminopimelate decarboxylase [Limnochorda sp. LNt]